MAQIKLAEYTFDNSVGDCLPTLRLSSIEMTTEDIVSGVVTRRTVYIDDTTLPYQLYFQNQTALLTVDYLHIGSNITNLASLFSGCTKLKTVNTTNWDLSSCTNVSFMFQNCSSLTKLDLRNWVTSSATTMQGMFHSCTSLTEIKGIENFNVSKVTSFGAMFYLCKSLTKLDLRNWVTSGATTFQDMFASCHNLEVIRVDNFDTSKVTGTGLNAMFSHCKKVKTLNLNSFVNAGLGNFLNFCYNCESLEYISAQNFIWGHCTAIQGVFTNCKSLKILDLTNFDGTTITSTGTLRLTGFNGVTCPIYYNSNMCTQYDTPLTSLSNAVDVQGRLMAVYDFNNTVTSTDVYPVLTGSTVVKTIDTQGSESYITHRVISVDTMPTKIKFGGIVTGLLNVDYLAVTSSCTQLGSLFADCIRLSSVNTFGWDTQNVTDLSSMFDDCSQLIEIDLSQCNFKNVESLYSTFHYCSGLETLHLPTTFTTSLISLGRTFWSCSKLSTITGLSEIDTSKVSNFDRTFEGVTSLMEIDLSKWNTSSATGSSGMFGGWTSDQFVYVHDTNWTIDVSSYNATFVRRLSTLLAKYTFNNSIGDCLPTFTGITTSDYKVSDIVNDTVTTRLITSENVLPTRYQFKGIKSLTRLEYLEMSEVTNMQDMLSACSNLEYLDVSQWNTSKVTNMYYGFIGCAKLTEIIGIEDLDVSNCTNLSCLFESCSGLTSLDLSKWNVAKCTLLNQLFYRCTSLVSVNLSGWNTTRNTNLGNLFNNCSNLTEIIGLETWDTSNVTNMSNIFGGCRKITSIEMVRNWNTSKVTNMAGTFSTMTSITSLEPILNWDTSKVATMANIFSWTGVKSFSFANWDTSNVGNMNYMLAGVNLDDWDISNLNTSNCNNMSNMFENCTVTGNLDLSFFDVHKVTNMANMFTRANISDTIILDNWDLNHNATNITYMFHACKAQHISFKWKNTDKITSLKDTFNGCSNLVSLDFSSWDTTSLTNIQNTFMSCGKLAEVDLSSFDFRNKNVATGQMFTYSKSDSTIYYDPALFKLDPYSIGGVHAAQSWVVRPSKNNGYWLDMSAITGDVTITLLNTNNLPTEEILTDWGDGTQNSELTHTYSTAGEYIIVTNLQKDHGMNSKLTPYLTKAVIYYYEHPQMLFYNCQKMTEVTLTDNWVRTVNEKGSSNMWRFLYDCTKLTKINYPQNEKIKPSSLSYAFHNCREMTSIDLGWIDYSILTNMEFTFSTCLKLTEIVGIEDVDTSKVTNMNGTFRSCSSLTSLDLSSWDTSQCTNMASMFTSCTLLTDVSFINEWDLSKVTSFNALCHGAKALTSFTLDGKDLSSLNNCNYMLAGNPNLQTVQLTNLTTQKTINVSSMFENDSGLTSVDFSGTIIKPNNTSLAFKNCSSLTSLDLSSWDTSQCTTLQAMFYGCSSLISLDLSLWNTSNVTSLYQTFMNCSSLSNLNVTNWDTGNVNSIAYAFQNCSKLKTLDLSYWTTNKVNSFANLFYNCSTLMSLDLSNFVVNKDNTTTNMFAGCSKLNYIGILYSNVETINTLTTSLNTSINKTIYYYDADPSQLTPVEGVTFKKYQVPTTIQLPPHIQLHSLPDGTRDEVDIKTGILTHNIGECTWNDSTVGWGVSIGDGSTTFYHLGDWGVPNYGTIQQDMNLPLEVNGNNTIVISPNVIGVEVWGNAEARKMNIHVPMKFNNENEAKQWLKENQVTFIYRKETPTTEQLILNYNNSCDYGRILPTGMCDKYSVVDSMYTQTMASILLDGVNTWDDIEDLGTVLKFTATGTTVGVDNLNMKGAGGLYCDNDLFPNINDDSDVEHCRVGEEGDKFYIYVDKERLMSPDLIGWQIWLQTNPFNMWYELEEHLIYTKPYEELDPTQARWDTMDCFRDGSIKYNTHTEDKLTIYPTLEYVAPSINNFEVPMLEPNTEYTMYAEGIGEGDTINLGGTDINFNNGTVYTSGENQWLRIDNNDSFYNMVITKGDTTGEVVPYFEGMTSVENPKVNTPSKNLFILQDYDYKANENGDERNVARKSENGTITFTSSSHGSYASYNIATGEYFYAIHGADIFNYDYAKTQTMVEGAGTYTIQLDGNCTEGARPIIYVYYDDNKIIEYRWQSGHDYSLKLTVEKKINFIAASFWYEGGIVNITISNIQVEKGEVATDYIRGGGSTVSYTDLKLRSLPNGVKDTINVVTGEYIQRVGEVVLDGNTDWLRGNEANGWNQSGTAIAFYSESNTSVLFNNKKKNGYSLTDKMTTVTGTEMTTQQFNHDCFGLGVYSFVIIRKNDINTSEELKTWLSKNPITVQYELAEPIVTQLDPQELLAYENGAIKLSSETGFLPTMTYSVPSTNVFNLPSMKTGTRYTLKYPSASGSIHIGDMVYKVTSSSMLFTTPLTLSGDASAVVFTDTNPQDVMLIEGDYSKREMSFFERLRSSENIAITTTYGDLTNTVETGLTLRSLPNGLSDKFNFATGKLVRVADIRDYQEGDNTNKDVYTDGYKTVYPLTNPVETTVEVAKPVGYSDGAIELKSDALIPTFRYRLPSSNNFVLDLLKPSTKYTMYANYELDGNFTLGGTMGTIGNAKVVSTSDSLTDTNLTFSGSLGLSNVMLIEGDSTQVTTPKFNGLLSVENATVQLTGSPTEINRLTIPDTVKLRSIGSIIDELDLVTGVFTKRIERVKLIGSENWQLGSHQSTNYQSFKIDCADLKQVSLLDNMTCDRFKPLAWTTLTDKAFDFITGNGTIEINIHKNNLTTPDVDGFKRWLRDNPTTVHYELSRPVTKTLDLAWTTKPVTSYYGTTTVQSTSTDTQTLKPYFQIVVPITSLEEIVDALKEKNARLEEDNLATMIAVTEVFEVMLLLMPVNMAVSNQQGGGSYMVEVYVTLILKGKKTLEQVPAIIRPQVEQMLKDVDAL